ncbi:Palmitoyltransferase PFA3 [Trichinella murrelli]|uniref:Palmitoyltransferase n=1 Tax=Trichinella murrelli TaxID=144512 RepID=A0A0V0U0G5_9BILA|nr:Palmitoyltransferase PFA3 [Trichinella murrelli]
MYWLSKFKRYFIQHCAVCGYWFGLTYLLFIFASLYYMVLFYFCPKLYGADALRRITALCSFVVAEAAINCIMFNVRAKYNRLDRVLARQNKALLPLSGFSTVNDESARLKTRYCSHCRAQVPKLCYHCPLCNYCVFKKDHHCFFLGGCVGFGNQRYFVVFLFWSIVGSVLAVYFTFRFLTETFHPFFPFGWIDYLLPVVIVKTVAYGQYSAFDMTCLICFYVAISSLCASVSFFIAQWLFVLTGRSMLGYFQMTDVFFGKEHPTIRQRIEVVFGPYWLLNFIIPMPYFNQPDKTYNQCRLRRTPFAKPNLQSYRLFQHHILRLYEDRDEFGK